MRSTAQALAPPDTQSGLLTAGSPAEAARSKPYVTRSNSYDKESNKNSVSQSLDTQYTLGLASAIPYTLISDGSASVQGFIDMANVVASQSSPPPVLSISYGFNENDFLGSEDVAKCVAADSLKTAPILNARTASFAMLSQRPLPVVSAL